MNKKEIEIKLKALGINIDIAKKAANVLSEIIDSVKNISGALGTIIDEEKIVQLHEIIESFYENQFPQWEGPKKSKFMSDVEAHDMEKPKYFRYLLTALALSDGSPWKTERLRKIILPRLRRFAADHIFAYYNLRLVYVNKKSKDRDELFERFFEQVYEAGAFAKLDKKIKDLETKTNGVLKSIQSTMINHVTLLGIFSAIIGFVIITSNITLRTKEALPLILVFGGTLFLFVVLLKFFSLYGNKWWQWLIVVIVCVLMIWIGLRTFLNMSILPF